MNFLDTARSKFLLLLLFALFAVSQSGAQQIPNLVYPADMDSCLDQQIIFQWDTVGAGEIYHIEISTSATWTEADIVDELLSHPTNTFSFTMPEQNAVYYWRVSASFTFQEIYYSETNQFSTLLGPNELMAPSDEMTCMPLNPALVWLNVEPADAYQLQVATSNTFTDDYIIYENLNVPSSSTTITTKEVIVPDFYTNYYWRVAAKHGECVAEWTDPWSFKTIQGPPSGDTPTDGEFGLPLTVILTWDEATDATEYDVEFATDSDFENIIDTFYGTTETSATVSELDFNTTYYWRVKDYIGQCESEWSDVYSFRTQFPAPELDLPYDGRICLEMSYQFRWYNIENATAYQMQIAADPEFEDVVIDEDNLHDIIHTVALPQGLTQYWWRIRVKEPNNTGDWSEIRTFTTTIETVDPIDPMPNAGGIPLTTTLLWSDVAGESGTFHLQVSDNYDFENTLYDLTDLTSNSYTIELPAYNTNYFWRVSAVSGQCEAEFSDPWMFTTVIDRPTLLSPENNATGVEFMVFFEWTAVESAKTYFFNLAKNPNFAPLDYGFKDIKNTHYNMTGLDPDTKYYWRVRAENEDGESAYSDVFSFTTSSVGATVPYTISPAVEATQVELDPTLLWSNANRADTYHLQVSLSGDFTDKLVDTDTITGTSYPLSGLENNTMYYWHVSAINDSGETRFSNLAYFTTIMLAPTDPAILTTPADEAIDLDPKRVILGWQAVENASNYDLEIATDDSFTNVVVSSEQSATQKIVNNLEYDTEYFWRVKGTNLSGEGPWSEAWSFKTKLYVSVNDEMSQKYNIGTYPNPFTNDNNLTFYLSDREPVVVRVHDISGKLITTLVNNTLPAGEHLIKWTPSGLGSSKYFYSIEIGNMKTFKEVTYTK